MDTANVIQARVRYHANTYRATAGYPQVAATSTSGARAAVQALMHKLFTGSAAARLLTTNPDGTEVWVIEATP
jgi:hypothetical protein